MEPLLGRCWVEIKDKFSNSISHRIQIRAWILLIVRLQFACKKIENQRVVLHDIWINKALSIRLESGREKLPLLCWIRCAILATVPK